MAVHRTNPKCHKCGGKIHGKYIHLPTVSYNYPSYVGDTFIGWDFEGHKCSETIILPKNITMEDNITKEKLDSFSKILLVTHAISYMTNQIHSVNEQIKMIPTTDKSIKEGIETRTRFLKETSELLHKVMEDIGDFMDNSDIGNTVDNKVMSPIFKIMQGEDNVE